jgi:hypothetical protein
VQHERAVYLTEHSLARSSETPAKVLRQRASPPERGGRPQVRVSIDSTSLLSTAPDRSESVHSRRCETASGSRRCYCDYIIIARVQYLLQIKTRSMCLDRARGSDPRRSRTTLLFDRLLLLRTEWHRVPVLMAGSGNCLALPGEPALPCARSNTAPPVRLFFVYLITCIRSCLMKTAAKQWAAWMPAQSEPCATFTAAHVDGDLPSAYSGPSHLRSRLTLQRLLGLARKVKRRCPVVGESEAAARLCCRRRCSHHHHHHRLSLSFKPPTVRCCSLRARDTAVSTSPPAAAGLDWLCLCTPANILRGW